MWPLIAFIVLGIVVATLIEVNERIKAKKRKPTSNSSLKGRETDCNEACADCSLISVCEKEEKSKN